MLGFPWNLRSHKCAWRRALKSSRYSVSREQRNWRKGKRRNASETTEVDMEAAEVLEGIGTRRSEVAEGDVDVDADEEISDLCSRPKTYWPIMTSWKNSAQQDGSHNKERDRWSMAISLVMATAD
jgi:YbbR domain-containing protein